MNEKFIINHENTLIKQIEKLRVEVRDELLKNGAINPDGTENTVYTQKKNRLDALIQEKSKHDKLVMPPQKGDY
jgi:hypothetical protein